MVLIIILKDLGIFLTAGFNYSSHTLSISCEVFKVLVFLNHKLSFIRVRIDYLLYKVLYNYLS